MGPVDVVEVDCCGSLVHGASLQAFHSTEASSCLWLGSGHGMAGCAVKESWVWFLPAGR